MNKRILIIQLARFGDILQTLPAIQGIKKKFPQSHLTLICRETFSDAARLSPHIDEIIEFSATEILGSYIQKPDSEGKTKSLELLSRWVFKNISQKPFYDVSYNLTFSESSAYLHGLVSSKEKKGMYRLSNDTLVIEDPWSQYVFAQVLGQNLNLLHLNDLFLRITGVKKECWPVEVVESKSIEHLNSLTQCDLIGIQLTASQKSKTLTIDEWEPILRALLSVSEKNHLVFFGSEKDKPSIESVVKDIDKSRYTVFAGKLKFNENIPLVKRCKYIVSPDTALIHLASICGVRTIYIGVNENVRPQETGPYGVLSTGENHEVLIVDRNAVKDSNALSRAVANLVSGDTSYYSGIAHAQVQFVNCSDGTKRNVISPVNFNFDDVHNFLAQSYYLLFEFRGSGLQEDIEIPTLGTSRDSSSLDSLVQRLLVVHDSLATVRKLAEFGQHYCIDMIKNIDNTKKLKHLMEQLLEIESLLMKLRENVIFIKPIIDAWKVGKDTGVPHKSLEEVLDLTEGCYRELGQNAEIMLNLLEVAVADAQKKPKVSEHGKKVEKELDA